MSTRNKIATPPWAAGPKEILEHGLVLLHKDSDKNRRLALLSIDNAVELTIKTYLGLPKRINGLQVPRKEYAEFSESFPKLVDALEQYASKKISGIDLGEIEWFHRLRNQLYHQGNGLTVDRDKVEVYSELAKLLFEVLFDVHISFAEEDRHQLLGEFLAGWVEFEKVLTDLVQVKVATLGGQKRSSSVIINELSKQGIVDAHDANEMLELREVRNEVVHGMENHKIILSAKLVKRLEELATKYRKIAEMESGE